MDGWICRGGEERTPTEELSIQSRSASAFVRSFARSLVRSSVRSRCICPTALLLRCSLIIGSIRPAYLTSPRLTWAVSRRRRRRRRITSLFFLPRSHCLSSNLRLGWESSVVPSPAKKPFPMLRRGEFTQPGKSLFAGLCKVKWSIYTCLNVDEVVIITRDLRGLTRSN